MEERYRYQGQRRPQLRRLDLQAVVGGVGTYKTFDIDIKPPIGSVLVIERTTPAALAPWMILN